MNIQPTLFITQEKTEEAAEIKALCEAAFGPGRFTRTAFRLREGVAHEAGLSFVCRLDGQLVGSVRLTRIQIGDKASLLLGPLVVASDFKNLGVGKQLVSKCVEAAKQQGEGSILLVGDFSYYGKLGFQRIPFGQITMPGPVDASRLLLCPLNDALNGVRGMVSSSPV